MVERHSVRRIGFGGHWRLFESKTGECCRKEGERSSEERKERREKRNKRRRRGEGKRDRKGKRLQVGGNEGT